MRPRQSRERNIEAKEEDKDQGDRGKQAEVMGSQEMDGDKGVIREAGTAGGQQRSVGGTNHSLRHWACSSGPLG